MSITLASPAPDRGTPSVCFSWCSHGRNFPGEHESAPATIALPRIPGENTPSHPLLAASLFSSDQFQAPQVSIESMDEDGVIEGVCLPAEQAEEFADRLIAFASRIRTMARLTEVASV